VSFWRSVGYLTSLGWMIALPIAAGVLLGRFIDEQLGSGTFWTLTLLGAGVGIAALELFLAASTTLTKDGRD
jgi:predicted F0F1-ATPase subunit